MIHNSLTAGNLPPATPSGAPIVLTRPTDIPQRTDYVPPRPQWDTIDGVDTKLLMAAHRFIEINAIHPEHIMLADDLRGILESGCNPRAGQVTMPPNDTLAAP